MNHILSRSFFASISLFLLVGCATKVQNSPVVVNTDTISLDTTSIQSPEATPSISQGPYQPAATRVMDLLHTRLKVRFDWAKQYLLGEATLTLKPYFYPQEQVILDAKGFDVHKVSMIQLGKEIPLQYAYDQKQLTVKLGKSYTRKDTLQLLIHYTAKPNELKVKGSDAITADKGLYFINPLGEEKGVPQQIWTQGETESSSCWFPTIDKPNERMTQEIYITVEDKFKTLSNGKLISSQKAGNGLRTDYWKMDQPHAPYLTMMAVGDFAVVKDTWRKKEVSYWVEPAYASTARATFGRTPEMLEFFSQKLGVPFAWDKYAQVVVRDFVSGAMENTSASTFMEELQQDKRQLIDKNWDHIIAHELFHQWFGDLVTIESWANLPLNESFADYSEYLWAEHKYGADEAAIVQQQGLQDYLQEAKTKQEPLIRYHHLDREDMFDSHSYAKGGRVLHMLRNLVGDEAFFSSLKLYLTQHRFSSVEIADLRLAFEEVTGQDLQWFFNQWFLQPGHPALEIHSKYQEGVMTVQVNQVQDSLRAPIYRLPLTINFLVGSKWQQVTSEVTNAREEFTFPMPEKPLTMVVDPEQTLLGTITQQKSAEEWESQFQYSSSYAAKYEALVQLKAQPETPAFTAVVLKAIQDPFWKIRATGVELLSETKLLKQKEVQEKIKSMAITDKHPAVRSMAIYILSTIEGDKQEQLLRQAMQDSSYQVVAASIYAWGALKNDVNTLLPLMKNENSDVVNALAANLTQVEGEGVYDWYLKQAGQLRRQQLYYFVQGFGAYLLRKSSREQEKGWDSLKKITAAAQQDFVKQASYQMLVLLADTEIRKREIENLMEKENNEELKAWWEVQKQGF